ncbi:MAG: hypothetical protein IT379_21700, partial [Deltaproteobacteria bacterium]|nr:hypothetical protein [Deltaproteobacteria bacterium]
MTRSNTARKAPLPRPEPGLDTTLRRARIETRDLAGGTVGVTFAPGTPRVSATLTLAAGAAAVGDTALCAIADDGGWYVLGVVPSYPREVRPGGERTVVRLPPGPVDVVADGDVTWSTTGAMRIEARAGVTLSAS